MKVFIWFFCAVVVVILDQVTKYLATSLLLPYQPEALLPMVNFTLAYNTGAAFSFLSGSGDWHRWFFTLFSISMSVFLLLWLIRLPEKAKWQSFSLSLILGGAIGNLLDRISSGHVVDFIDVFYKNYHWPIFNLADSAICLGAIFLLGELCKKSS